jgi:hypothetical protein
VKAQTNDSVALDTTGKSIAQRKAELLKKKFVANQAQSDTLDKKKSSVRAKKIFVPDPNKSMWYALICPGLGQIYNRRYWKLPIVYGGFVGLAYGIGWNGKYYKLYSRAYRDFNDSNPDTHSFDVLPKSLQNASVLKTRMDATRRYRDLCIIGAVAFYGITILDAFVDAALSDFDISPDLSMKIIPQVIQNQENTALAMHIKLNF